MESWQSEGSGEDHHSVGVEIKKSGTSSHYNAMYEIQRITMSGPKNYEKSIIKIVGPSEGYFRLEFTSATDGKTWET